LTCAVEVKGQRSTTSWRQRLISVGSIVSSPSNCGPLHSATVMYVTHTKIYSLSWNRLDPRPCDLPYLVTWVWVPDYYTPLYSHTHARPIYARVSLLHTQGNGPVWGSIDSPSSPSLWPF